MSSGPPLVLIGKHHIGFQNVIFAVAALGVLASQTVDGEDSKLTKKQKAMNLGAFSTSLAVKDLAKSRAFYENLGFERVMGDPDQNWLILRNGETTIGLFQGVFEENIMTFNPGWNSQAEKLEEFDDIRDIQKCLKANGLTLATEVDESGEGPASLTLVDPDGNQILLDQHVG